MQIELKDIEYCRVSALFEDDPDRVERRRQDVIEYFKKENIPGYRKNHAPTEVVKYHFKDRIENVLTNELAQDAFQIVITEKQLKPFGKPQYLSMNLTGSKFNCEFCFNKLPEVELKQYKNFELPKPALLNLAEGTEKLLQELRSQGGESIPYQENDFLEVGHSAIIDYTITDPQSNITIRDAQGELFIVGNSPLKALNDNLLGMQIDEVREFTDKLTGEADPELAAKEAKFKVKLTMAAKSIPAPLDDNLAIKLGFQNLPALQEAVQGVVNNARQEAEQQYFAQQISARLLTEYEEIVIPTWLAKFEAQAMAKSSKEEWEQLADDKKDAFMKQASNSVKLSLILDKVKNAEPEAQLTDEEVINIIKANLHKFMEKNSPKEKPEEIFKNILGSDYLPVLIARIRDEYTLNFIAKTSNITE